MYLLDNQSTNPTAKSINRLFVVYLQLEGHFQKNSHSSLINCTRFKQSFNIKLITCNFATYIDTQQDNFISYLATIKYQKFRSQKWINTISNTNSLSSFGTISRILHQQDHRQYFRCVKL